MLLEVCAPVHFMNGYCARYSEFDKRIINDTLLDCTKFDPPCLSRFPSNESYKSQKNETKDEEENEANESSARLLDSIESRKGNGERNGE